MSQKSEIISKARELGLIDGYVNDSELETLQSIAKKVGMSSYNGLSNSDTDELEQKLKNYSSQQENSNYDNSSDSNSSQSEQSSENLKDGFGRNEFSKTIGNKDYYKNEADALRLRLEAARAEKSKNFKKTGSDKDPIKADGSNTKEKNLLDKAKDTVGIAKAQNAVLQNKINSVKSKVYQAEHPIEAAKAQAKAKVKSKAKTLLLKYWWVIGIAALFLLLFLIIMLIILGFSNAEASEESFIDPRYDFTQTIVYITNSYDDETEKQEIGTLSLEDFVKGFVYVEFKDLLEGKTSTEKRDIYKAAIVIANSLALSVGNYNSSTKEITIQSGSGGLPYCDIYFGCKIYNNNGNITYYSADYTAERLGEYTAAIDAMEIEDEKLLSDAYASVKYMLLVPKDVNSVITTFNYTIPYTQSIKQKLVDNSDGESTYKDIISQISEYENYKIYNSYEYARSYNYAEGNSYWWPIGSKEPDSSGLYSGDPTKTNITSPFGNRNLGDGVKKHTGIDIGGGCNSEVIIAAKSGTVVEVYNGCPTKGSYCDSCGGYGGNHVKIDHGDGTLTIYAHLALDSIVVKEGQQVRQGEKIGKMGSSGCSTGCHLHFEIRVNGTPVDPEEYVDASNPRPRLEKIQGNGVKQTVCFALKELGYSNAAVAAIMTNINAESSFNPNIKGDSDTSYGLCQWHNDRWLELKQYCSNEYTTVKCQLSFLAHELRNKSSFSIVNSYLLGNHNAWDMTRQYCYYFEVPANRETVCKNRADNSNGFVNYVNNNCS